MDETKTYLASVQQFGTHILRHMYLDELKKIYHADCKKGPATLHIVEVHELSVSNEGAISHKKIEMQDLEKILTTENNSYENISKGANLPKNKNDMPIHIDETVSETAETAEVYAQSVKTLKDNGLTVLLNPKFTKTEYTIEMRIQGETVQQKIRAEDVLATLKNIYKQKDKQVKVTNIYLSKHMPYAFRNRQK